MIFDIKPDDVYWCAADIGWVTGHSYIVYGPLANATTGILYEGTPDTPAWDRWWQIIEDYKVTILYCAPTAIRAFMKQGAAHPARPRPLDRCASSARSASRSTPRRGSGTTSTSAAARRPIVDTWWQTETGHDPDHAAARRHDDEAGLATFPFPGIAADVVDADGRLRAARPGRLPRPEAAVAVDAARHLRRPERYRQTYWSRFPGMYFAGDGAKRDEDGYFWLLGRVDDVMNVSGHRLSTTEIESALVVPSGRRRGGRRRRARSRSPARRSTPSSSSGSATSRRTRWATSCAQHVATKISPIAKPKTLMFTPDLPKTRSGKIMRRLLRDIAEGQPLGDTTTLADAGVVELIREHSGATEE